MRSYCYNIEDLSEELYLELFSLLDQKTKKHIQKISSYKDRKRSLVSHFLMVLAACEETGKDLREIMVKRGPSGKPYIKDFPVFVNTSHSGNRVVCVSDTKPVGVDIEQIRPLSKEILRFFDKKEVSKINEVYGSHYFDDEKNIIKLWTKKEAYIKLKDLPFSSIRSLDLSKIETERFETIEKDGYVITICSTI